MRTNARSPFRKSELKLADMVRSGAYSSHYPRNRAKCTIENIYKQKSTNEWNTLNSEYF